MFTPVVHSRTSEVTSRFRWVRTILLEEDLHGCNGVRFDDFPIEELGVEHVHLLS